MAKRKSTLVDCVCKVCQSHFLEKPSIVKNGGGKFCCRSCYLIDHRARPAIERFQENIGKPDENGCWPWIGGGVSRGYGSFVSDSGKRMKVHRYAWELVNGPIPYGLCVLHKCDNPSCVNPHHLFIGTLDENSKDMINKGRSCRGERHPNSKLTENDVASIRTLRDNGLSYSDLARRFCVNQTAIAKIVKRENWSHV